MLGGGIFIENGRRFSTIDPAKNGFFMLVIAGGIASNA